MITAIEKDYNNRNNRFHALKIENYLDNETNMSCCSPQPTTLNVVNESMNEPQRNSLYWFSRLLKLFHAKGFYTCEAIKNPKVF